MKVQFKATQVLEEYHCVGLNMTDGDVAEVSEEKGKQLLRDFPKNFSKVIEKADDKKAKGEKVNSKAPEAPPENKMVTSAERK